MIYGLHIKKLQDRLKEHADAGKYDGLEEEEMAAGRVIDAIKDLPMGDWSVLCDILRKGLQ